MIMTCTIFLHSWQLNSKDIILKIISKPLISNLKIELSWVEKYSNFLSALVESIFHLNLIHVNLTFIHRFLWYSVMMINYAGKTLLCIHCCLFWHIVFFTVTAWDLIVFLGDAFILLHLRINIWEYFRIIRL